MANPPWTTSILSQLCVNLAFTFCCILNPHNPCPCFYTLNKYNSLFLLSLPAPCAWGGAGSEVTSPRQDMQMQITETGHVYRGVTSAWRQGEKIPVNKEQRLPLSLPSPPMATWAKSWNISVRDIFSRTTLLLLLFQVKAFGKVWNERSKFEYILLGFNKKGLYPVSCEFHFSLQTIFVSVVS